MSTRSHLIYHPEGENFELWFDHADQRCYLETQQWDDPDGYNSLALTLALPPKTSELLQARLGDDNPYLAGLRQGLEIAESIARTEEKRGGQQMPKGWEARVIATHIKDHITRQPKKR